MFAAVTRLLLNLILFCCFLSGCGYHFTNTQSGRLSASQQIWVPFFSNESVSPTAQTVLRRAFYDELNALRGLRPATSEGTADLVMKAKLISYSSKAVSYNALDQVKEFSLSVDVELEISKKGDLQPLWKGRIQAVKQFPVNNNLSLQRNSEEQALDAASRIIAQKFIAALDESY